MNKSGCNIQEHNQQQRKYFEKSVKRTMLPGDTPYIRHHVQALLRFGNIGLLDRVLEVGCGMGRYTLCLAKQGIKVEGLDLSPVLLNRLRSFDNGGYNIPLYCADILDPPPELAGRFDAVIGFFTLHHFHDLFTCFSAMSNLIKPGGCLVFLEPNPYNPLYYLQIFLTPGMTWKGDRGLIRMRHKLIFQAMQNAGLELLEMSRFGFFPPFLANQPWGLPLQEAFERLGIFHRILPFQLFKGKRAPFAP